MTNRVLLMIPKERLTPAERQKQFLLLTEVTPAECPACRELCDALTAAGIGVDAFDFGSGPRTYHCPRCGVTLERVAPPPALARPGWHWRLEPAWLAERLHKARLYEQMTTPAADEVRHEP